MASNRKLFRVRLKAAAYQIVEVEAYDAEEASERAFDCIGEEGWEADDPNAAEVELVERV